MSKTSSDFAAFANAADKTKSDVKSNDIYSTKNTQLTVGELMRILQKIIQKDPDARDAKISHIEMGGITSSTTVEVCDEGVIISNFY